MTEFSEVVGWLVVMFVALLIISKAVEFFGILLVGALFG